MSNSLNSNYSHIVKIILLYPHQFKNLRAIPHIEKWLTNIDKITKLFPPRRKLDMFTEIFMMGFWNFRYYEEKSKKIWILK